jgi:prepilin-type N-terminal cleavage/methylation domain-containing protein
MMAPMNPTRHRLGFTLVEMAVVLVIFGTLLGAGLKLLTVQVERSAIELTKQRQETVKQALISYLGRMGRLPCPDQNAIPDGMDNADRTATTPATCLAQFGAIPYIDLGLDRDTALDGWDNYMVYGVSPDWQNSYNPVSNSQYQNTTPSNVYWPGARPGRITLFDRIPATNASTTITANPATGTGAAAVILSYGHNGAGARNLSNNINVAPSAGTDEEMNTLFTGMQVAKREYTDQDIAVYGAFDDIVLPISATDFLAPLVKSGAIQDTGASAILIAASAQVQAQIMATKTECPNGAAPTCMPNDYYYTVPTTLTSPLPTEAMGWNATYNGTATNIYVGTNSTATAYSIMVSDGINNYSKTVTMLELKSALSRNAGFH